MGGIGASAFALAGLIGKIMTSDGVVTRITEIAVRGLRFEEAVDDNDFLLDFALWAREPDRVNISSDSPNFLSDEYKRDIKKSSQSESSKSSLNEKLDSIVDSRVRKSESTDSLD